MKKFIILLLTLLAAAGPLQASERPKIGLALSGGGARGAAHIGVLKVLEELNIPIDYIAGTSMGAIVGGLYAVGRSPEEIEKVALETNWTAIMLDRSTGEDWWERIRNVDGSALLTMDGLPQGLVTGHKLYTMLNQNAGVTLGSFDELPIPFRAVSVDIESGRKYVHESGKLADALWGSMAVPGVFAPVEIGGQMLMDGGIVSNLPIDLVREMGADIVIAVNVTTPLFKREELDSFIRISNQLIRLMTSMNSNQQIETLRSGDVLIEPQLDGIKSAGFMSADEAILAGIEAAVILRDDLICYSLDGLRYREYLERLGRGDEPPAEDEIEGLWQSFKRVVKSLVSSEEEQG